MVHLRERLAIYVRTQRGDTPQRRFARRIGVAQSTIMRIENQEQNVTLDTLEQLCRAFHVDVAGLFAEDMKKGPTEYAGRHTSRPVTPVQQVVHEPVAGKKTGAKSGQPTKVGHKKKSQDL
ncbi:hypothetical protein GCM10011403_26310 [Pseudohongiella nitratireducens]|jgi:transcriptional regulator with XRE-family HTH domain|uniref:HTH cro/C1-type domain-containing protein n=1 Tax=Pseudohongiella nitratireducens TaxID=1768907 RepID=A0A916VJJ1_9GAMM|nr:helix-turn-helix transcriptional regulator [Pseudohongiella nitratireducens]GFZ81676.1 hypothetical protein GCM10011403_26310 [Pseudohongiella nitratireducens]